MTDRQRRIAKLVDDIRAALDRGVSPEQIHQALVRKRLPPEKATLLLQRILTERTGGTTPRGTSPAMGQGPTSNARPHSGPAPGIGSATPDGPRHETTGAPPGVAAHTDTTPDGTAPAPTRPRRRRRAPFFVALAIILIAGGFTGVVLTSRAEVEQQARTRALEALAGRLDAELATAREQLAYIDGRLEERRVDAEQIEWLRARVARGPDSFESFADYEELYGMYERRRARWNRTLPQYRVVANAYRTLAGIHNAKLDSLNALGLPTPVTNGEDRADRYVRIAAVTVPLQ